MAKAYQYTADGFYAGALEDYGLLPNNATRTAPAIVDGKIPHWTGDGWEQVENHKGKSGYLNGAPYTIKEYGPLPDGWSTAPALPTLADAQATVRTAINAGFDTAMAASLTMPSASAPPSAYAVAVALYDWRAEDPEGYAALLAIHTARRDDLLAAVDAATTVVAVQDMVVSYAV